MNRIKELLRRIDDRQQRSRWLGFPFAVVKKFGDDQAGNLAALIAYYGFFSLFPLLLVLVAVLGFALRTNVELRNDILDSAVSQFPIIGDQLKNNIKALTGEGAGVALGIGTATALWAGLGVMQATQTAFNEVWDVPRKERPKFLEARLRGFIMLLILGALVLSSTFTTGFVTGGGRQFFWLGALGLVLSLLLNVALYSIAFRVLTDRALSWRDVFPGAVVGGVAWTALQSFGGYFLQHQVKNSSALYGFFGFVLGLLTWIYLGAQITLLAAEVNVVRKNHLWPRSLTPPPLTEGDQRTYARAAKAQQRLDAETVGVTFDPDVTDDGSTGDTAAAEPDAVPGEHDDAGDRER